MSMITNKLKNHVLKQTLDEIDKGSVPKNIYKYYFINENFKNCMTGKYFWCSSPSNFNDPYDTMYNRNSHVSIHQIPGQDEDDVKQAFVEIFNQTAKEQRISCFSDLDSKKSKEILMWSHYGDNHKGVCVKYDLRKLLKHWIIHFPNTFFFPIKYTTEYPDIPYQYVGDGIVITRLDFLRTKYLEWDYEQEYRVFHTANKLPFPEDAVLEIRFGCLSSNVDIKKIMQLCDYVDQFKKAHKSLTSFKLEYIDI